MKRRILTLILSALMMLSVLIFSSCSDPYKDAEKFETASIELVEITQITKTEFDIQVTLPLNGQYSNAKVYFSVYDKVKEGDEEISYTLNQNKISFNLNRDAGDYFLFVNTDAVNFIMPITIPKMSPFVTLRESTDGVYAAIDYSVDGKTSWSSFIDPTGKAVYKSEANVFDDTAIAVKLKAPITEGVTNDLNYSSDSPYYYIVFTGKNGKLIYTSFAMTTANNLFSSVEAELTASPSNAPVLKITAAKINEQDSFRLVIRTDGESFHTESDSNGVFTFSPTQLTKEGVWYDILLEDKKTGQQFNLVEDNAVSMSATVAYASRTFKLSEWNKDLKIYFETNT